MIRQDAEMPVSRFCLLVGIPRRTYCRLQALHRSGAPTGKGPWPSPSVEVVQSMLEDYLRNNPGFGHRRIHALLAADGHTTSLSTVLRAMRRQDRGPGGSPA
jgi:putative transposase